MVHDSLAKLTLMPAKLRCFVAMAFGRKDTDAIFTILKKTLER
jgi:hypothetical protein